MPWEIYLKSLFFFVFLFFLVWAAWPWPGWAGAGGWGWASKARLAPWSLLRSLKADKAILSGVSFRQDCWPKVDLGAACWHIYIYI